MNIGDYVRTDYNIGKIIEILQQTDVDEPDLKLDVSDCNDYPYIFKSEVIKSSPNIIDILEVGDYVNGHKVLEKNNYYVEVESEDIQSETWEKIYCNDIESILTKEQFSQMEYKL